MTPRHCIGTYQQVEIQFTEKGKPYITCPFCGKIQRLKLPLQDLNGKTITKAGLSPHVDMRKNTQ